MEGVSSRKLSAHLLVIVSTAGYSSTHKSKNDISPPENRNLRRNTMSQKLAASITSQSETVDIEQWVRDWVKQSDTQIDWNQVTIVPATPLYTGSLRPGSQATTEIVATYENKTKNEQTYQLSAKRKAHCEWALNLQTGFSRGFGFDVTMETPKEVTRYGFPNLVAIRTDTTPRFDEALTMEINTPVKVSTTHRATVSITTSDAVYEGSFTQDIKVRGKVTVNLYKDTLFKARKEINLRELALRQSRLEGQVTIGGPGSDGIIVHVAGTCMFRFASNQHITVQETPLAVGAQQPLVYGGYP